MTSLTLSGARSSGPRRSLWPLRRSTTISLLSTLLFLAVWQIAPALGLVNVRFTSQPSAVLGAALAELPTANFARHAWVSLKEFAAGFALFLWRHHTAGN